MTATTKVFRSGNSQAVRLPKDFQFKVKEVEIFRRGDEVVLREKRRGMGRVLDIIDELPEDMFDIPADGPPQKRKGL